MPALTRLSPPLAGIRPGWQYLQHLEPDRQPSGLDHHRRRPTPRPTTRRPSASATPTVSGLQAATPSPGLAEAYARRNAGTGKTLTVTGLHGQRRQRRRQLHRHHRQQHDRHHHPAALTITAATDTKTYDATTTAARHADGQRPAGQRHRHGTCTEAFAYQERRAPAAR